MTKFWRSWSGMLIYKVLFGTIGPNVPEIFWRDQSGAVRNGFCSFQRIVKISFDVDPLPAKNILSDCARGAENLDLRRELRRCMGTPRWLPPPLGTASVLDLIRDNWLKSETFPGQLSMRESELKSGTILHNSGCLFTSLSQN